MPFFFIKFLKTLTSYFVIKHLIFKIGTNKNYFSVYKFLSLFHGKFHVSHLENFQFVKYEMLLLI